LAIISSLIRTCPESLNVFILEFFLEAQLPLEAELLKRIYNYIQDKLRRMGWEGFENKTGCDIREIKKIFQLS